MPISFAKDCQMRNIFLGMNLKRQSVCTSHLMEKMFKGVLVRIKIVIIIVVIFLHIHAKHAYHIILV